ncbi:zinc finger BED domain-containing protein RICESLEEPER 1-like [Camellia sinensis]|uniref:zinc finger BED domain-containing protein RICESLEEPER 1-like n=1 Tax=Camellia sinensis TaxID=4442 RepID=UPI0010369038|nr:zinc finger BED domain-containing protein RICESLEEPER 1-like [Camellia sinensis]
MEDVDYLSLTAHFIDDDWQLKKKVLNFIMVDPSHTEDMLSEVIMTTNIIKLMVQYALEALLEVTHKIRESIKYVRSSQSTQEKFNGMVHLVSIDSQKCLCVDNSTRWNSTYFLVEAALVYKDVFSLLQEHDPIYTLCPSDIEWSRASAITGYLKLFVENSDTYLSSLALKMKSKFDEYWKKCSLALAVAAILDPRFKMKLVEYYYPQIYGMSASDCIDIVSNCMKTLYNGHAICSPLDSHGQGLSCQVGGDGGGGNESRDRLTGFDRFLHETSQSQNTKSDLDKYLEEPLFPHTVDFSILNWWKVHTPRYPILSMMARNISGIPMSKVSSEFAFNTGDRMLDHYRSSLRSDTVQALMCAQDWMRNEPEG